MKLFTTCLVTGMMICSAGSALASDPTVTAGSMATAPTLDGKADEWSAIAPVAVKVAPANAGDAKNFTGTIDAQVRAAVSGDDIYFLVQWPDDSKDDTHKTLTWSKEKDGYEEGKDREDRLILKFDMGGEFTACMLSGKDYKADIWHWKAFRSGSAGYAHDKMHIISHEQKVKKSKKHPSRDGKEVWVARPGDEGSKPYKSQRPIDNIGDTVPRYLVAKEWSGSIADVRAAATHDGSMWTLELKRKMATGHDDDVTFESGKSYGAGMAVFNHTGDDHHSVAGFTLDIK